MKTQMSQARDALQSIIRAYESDNEAAVPAALAYCRAALAGFRENKIPLFETVLNGYDDMPAGTGCVMYDDRGIITTVLPEGKDYPYSSSMEITGNAGVVMLGGAAEIDDAVACCHLDDKGVHVQAWITSEDGLPNNAVLVDGEGDITPVYGNWKQSENYTPD